MFLWTKDNSIYLCKGAMVLKFLYRVLWAWKSFNVFQTEYIFFGKYKKILFECIFNHQG